MAEEFGVAADGAEWSSELMRGVCHELAHPRLRGGPGIEGALDLTQHLVEADRQLPNLGSGVGDLHPLAQVAGSDRSGRGADPL